MTENHQPFAALAARYRARRKAASAFGWVFVALTTCGLLGLIVCLILIGLGKASETLLTILCCLFPGGIVVFGLAAFGTMRLATALEKKERDCLERADGENSFFVGEGTLATFCETALRIRGAAAGGKREKTIAVPYGEMRFFSVCTRRAPKEKGEWSVVLEIPMKYLAKDGKRKQDEPPALIQTDGKPRLYETLKAYNLTLLGEPPIRGGVKKYKRLRRFVLPDADKRKKAWLIAGLGAALIAGGIAAALCWNTTVGSVVAVVGAYLAIQGGLSYARAKSVFSVYREGIYWKERTQIDNMFLKWEEIVRLSPFERDGLPFLKAECLYGAYEYPNVNGAYEYLKEKFPEKCEKE